MGGSENSTIMLTNPSEVEMTLLCQWKQISATLLHGTYVTNGFSHFDSRTANIERALRDLDPLLRIYAEVSESSQIARLLSLRVIMQKGAKLALILFAQPCFWQFDWVHSPSVVPAVKICDERFSENLTNIGSEACEDEHTKKTVKLLDLDYRGEKTASAPNLVIWPALLRVMDGEGASIPKEERTLSRKITLSDIKSVA